MKTLKELSRMIAWLVVAGFLFFSGLYFYDSVREYRQEKFSFDREISELQAQIKAQDAKILELQELVKQQNMKIESQKTVVVNEKDKTDEAEGIIIFVGLCIVGFTSVFAGYSIIKKSKK